MVHALNAVQKLLSPAGELINVQSLPAPCLIEVRTPAGIFKAGWLSDKTGFSSELAGFEALFRVVAEGLFSLEDERDFEHHIHTDSCREFHEWLSVFWESAILPESTDRRIEAAIRGASGQAEIVTIIPARMTKLRAANF